MSVSQCQDRAKIYCQWVLLRPFMCQPLALSNTPVISGPTLTICYSVKHFSSLRECEEHPEINSQAYPPHIFFAFDSPGANIVHIFSAFVKEKDGSVWMEEYLD